MFGDLSMADLERNGYGHSHSNHNHNHNTKMKNEFDSDDDDDDSQSEYSVESTDNISSASGGTKKSGSRRRNRKGGGGGDDSNSSDSGGKSVMKMPQDREVKWCKRIVAALLALAIATSAVTTIQVVLTGGDVDFQVRVSLLHV